MMNEAIQNRIDAFCQTFGCSIPIVAAPMQGVTTPALVAAVSEAGGLGILAGDDMPASALEEEIRAVQKGTSAPFAVNLRVADKRVDYTGSERIDAAFRELKDSLGCPSPYVPPDRVSFEEQLDVVLACRVPVVSVSFGGLREVYAERLADAHIKMIGAATTLREAKVMRSAGVDAVLVQGVEAGGPRLCFEESDTASCVGLLSLIGPAARATGLPVVAAGGLVQPAQMLAALVSGASALALGSALLRSTESGACECHKEQLAYLSDSTTELTRIFSGRLTRVIPNGLTQAAKESGLVCAPYPAQSMAMREIDEAAKRLARPDLLCMPAGQSAQYASSGRAADIVSTLWERVLSDLHSIRSGK